MTKDTDDFEGAHRAYDPELKDNIAKVQEEAVNNFRKAMKETGMTSFVISCQGPKDPNGSPNEVVQFIFMEGKESRIRNNVKQVILKLEDGNLQRTRPDGSTTGGENMIDLAKTRMERLQAELKKRGL